MLTRKTNVCPKKCPKIGLINKYNVLSLNHYSVKSDLKNKNKTTFVKKIKLYNNYIEKVKIIMVYS